MKLADITMKGRRRNAVLLMAGIGTAAAMTLAPVAVGVAQAGAATASVVATTTTTVMTNGTWTVMSAGVSTSKALVECPYLTYTKIATAATADWIWAHYPTTNAGCRTTGNGPTSAPANSTVTLSTTFDVPGIPQGATLALAADNGAAVKINTTVVATLSPATIPTTNFTTVHTYTTTAVLSELHQGTNTITITGYNGPTSGYDPAGVIAKLTVISNATTMNLCKHTGWRQWTTPMFQNQGDCVSYFMGKGNDPTIPNTAKS